MGTVQIRTATVADAEGIARVHVDSWRETYQGIVPDDFLRNLSYEKRMTHWSKFLTEAEGPWKVFVAEQEGEIKGFAKVGLKRDDSFPYAGELYAIYLMKDMQGRSIGRDLFKAGLGSLKSAGLDGMYCWVLRDNPALEFYQYMGGREFSRKMLNIGGADLEEIAIGWKEI
jgi:ribosomal protein S18 acetylase RimI-like enzyme